MSFSVEHKLNVWLGAPQTDLNSLKHQDYKLDSNLSVEKISFMCIKKYLNTSGKKTINPKIANVFGSSFKINVQVIFTATYRWKKWLFTWYDFRVSLKDLKMCTLSSLPPACSLKFL